MGRKVAFFFHSFVFHSLWVCVWREDVCYYTNRKRNIVYTDTMVHIDTRQKRKDFFLTQFNWPVLDGCLCLPYSVSMEPFLLQFSKCLKTHEHVFSFTMFKLNQYCGNFRLWSLIKSSPLLPHAYSLSLSLSLVSYSISLSVWHSEI